MEEEDKSGVTTTNVPGFASSPLRSSSSSSHHLPGGSVGVARMVLRRRRRSREAFEAEDLAEEGGNYENVEFGVSIGGGISNLDKGKSASAQEGLHADPNRFPFQTAGAAASSQQQRQISMNFHQRVVSSSSSNVSHQFLPRHPPSRAVTFSSSSHHHHRLLLRPQPGELSAPSINNKRAAAAAAIGTPNCNRLNGHPHNHPNQNQQATPSNHRPKSQSSSARGSARSSSVSRNPSRLYRVVRPLASVTPTPSPATKRCVGPEFVVMAAASEQAPVYLDLASGRALGMGGSSRSQTTMGPVRAEVLMLSGQRIVCAVSPTSTTAGEVLDNVLSNQVKRNSRTKSLL